MLKILTLALCLLGVYGGPSPLRNVKLSASVRIETANGFFIYEYTVFNPVTSDGEIWSFDIYLPYNPQKEMLLSKRGFTYCFRYHKDSSQDIAARTNNGSCWF